MGGPADQAVSRPQVPQVSSPASRYRRRPSGAPGSLGGTGPRAALTAWAAMKSVSLTSPGCAGRAELTQPSGRFHRCTCQCPRAMSGGSASSVSVRCRFHTCRPVHTDPGARHLQRHRHPERPPRLDVHQGLGQRVLPVEVGGQPPAPVAVQQRVNTDVRIALQMGSQHICGQRQVVPLLMRDPALPPAAHRREPALPASTGILDPRGPSSPTGLPETAFIAALSRISACRAVAGRARRGASHRHPRRPGVRMSSVIFRCFTAGHPGRP